MVNYKITIIGEANTDYLYLEELDGIDCQDNFAEYFDEEHTFKENIESGYMDFKFKDGKLLTYTTYHSNRELTETELEDLIEYTQGQWSDGIGEGFEQHPCFYAENGEEVFISPWFFGQEITVKQEKQ